MFLLRPILLGFLAPVYAATAPLHLVWEGLSPSSMWEATWIHELLEKVDLEIVEVVDLTMSRVYPNALLVLSNPNPQRLEHLLTLYTDQGAPFGIIQLSDEELHYANLDYKGASFILKNYWSKELAKKDSRVLFIPLGYKRGFWDGFEGVLKEPGNRTYTWSFAGNVSRPQRLKMARSMGTIEDYFFYRADGFNSRHALSTSEYRGLLLESILSPCPIGNCSFDSFRVYESLEAGCIPVVQSTHKGDYFENLLGPHPMIIVEDWNEAPRILGPLLEDPNRLKEKQMECLEFWKNKKKELKEKVHRLVEEAFANS